MKPLPASKVFLPLAILAFLLCSPALAQKPEKTQKPWIGKHADGRPLTRADLDEILRDHNLWVQSQWDEERKGKRADLSGSRLWRADLSGADLSGANLWRANLSEANLSEADLRKGDLRKADLKLANLSKTKLFEAILSGAELRKANLSRANLSEANLSEADLSTANLSGALLVAANLSGANLGLAKLSGAKLWEADLSRAKLRGANLSGAKLNGADLSGADLKGADMSGAVFEPKPDTVSDVTLLFNIQRLYSLHYAISPHGLLELREAYKKAGLREYERQVTYAINHTRSLKQWEKGFWGQLESLFQWIFFEWTCQYGMSPGRPLEVLGVGLLVFTLPYLLALWSRDRETGIWLVLPPDRILGKGSRYPPYKLSHRTPFRPLPPGRWARFMGKFKRLRRVLRLAFYFSLLSAFRLGWRELKVGNWISRLQKQEYILGATGWPRFVAGFQSLLSVYFLALWALTYFGRPFG